MVRVVTVLLYGVLYSTFQIQPALLAPPPNTHSLPCTLAGRSARAVTDQMIVHRSNFDTWSLMQLPLLNAVTGAGGHCDRLNLHYTLPWQSLFLDTSDSAGLGVSRTMQER